MAIALASEAWAALRRVDAVDELEGKVEVLEAIAGIASAAGLDTPSVLDHVARHAAAAHVVRPRRGLPVGRDRRVAGAGGVLGVGPSLDGAVARRHPGPGAGDRPAAGRGAARHRRALRGAGQRHLPLARRPLGAEEGVVSLYARPAGRRRAADRAAGRGAHRRQPPWLQRALRPGRGGPGAAGDAGDQQRTAVRRPAGAAEQSRRADRQRADWVAGITHDLRSPVTAIVGFARTLNRAGRQDGPQDQADALDVIERQAMRVSRMLEDMMDAARAQVDQLRPGPAARGGPDPAAWPRRWR
jgi:signal transduction histidine kinase